MAGLKTILFIEDDAFISDMFADALRNAGYRIDIAVNGTEGAQKAKEQSYDLILLDIMIPEKTGIEVLEELRGKDGGGLPATKIVILTNYAQDDQSRRALESKADGYLIKADLTPKKLVELVNQLLKGNGSTL